jgi:CRP-like cAMP-binding protein
MSLLTGQPRSATVIAEEETEVLQIKKPALRPLFETNPDLMNAICEIIEERRKLLKTPDEHVEHADDHREKGVLSSIRNFFGLNYKGN